MKGTALRRRGSRKESDGQGKRENFLAKQTGSHFAVLSGLALLLGGARNLGSQSPLGLAEAKVDHFAS